MNNKASISIIIPVYSGADYIEDLFNRILKIKSNWELEIAPIQIEELIFVDDKSIDNSRIILDKLSDQYYWVHVINLSKNFGQHPATIAGILHSSGNWVVTLDEDLQHPPEKIEVMLYKALIHNLDVVYASSKVGTHANFFRDNSSKLIKNLMILLTGNIKIKYFNSFRLIKGDIARSASSACGHDTYLDIAISWYTNSIDKIEFYMKDFRNDHNNKSGYSISKLFSHAIRMFLSSQIRLYRLIALLGFFIFLFGLTYSGVIFINELIYPGKYGSRGWPSLMITSMFFGSISIILLSFVLEYISIIVMKTQGKPIYFIKNKINTDILLNYLKNKYESC
jgi:polyisoprenyl-phosphate glycosyltransferase